MYLELEKKCTVGFTFGRARCTKTLQWKDYDKATLHAHTMHDHVQY